MLLPHLGTYKYLLARKSLGLAYHATCALENEIRVYAFEGQKIAQDLCAPTIFLRCA